MANYWFTRHYPRPASLSIEWFFYFQDRHDEEAAKLSEGGMIVFYETSRGKRMKFLGDKEFDARSKGRSAVVGIAEVIGGIQPVGIARTLVFSESPNLQFKWQVPCKGHHRGQKVPYSRVLQILKTNNPYIINGSAAQIDKIAFTDFVKELAPLTPCSATGL